MWYLRFKSNCLSEENLNRTRDIFLQGRRGDVMARQTVWRGKLSLPHTVTLQSQDESSVVGHSLYELCWGRKLNSSFKTDPDPWGSQDESWLYVFP